MMCQDFTQVFARFCWENAFFGPSHFKMAWILTLQQANMYIYIYVQCNEALDQLGSEPVWKLGSAPRWFSIF